MLNERCELLANDVQNTKKVSHYFALRATYASIATHMFQEKEKILMNRLHGK